MCKRIGVALFLGILLAGCATDSGPAYERDGVAYGVTRGVFRGRWWSYYERGASFLAGGFLDEARADFEKALTGRSRDSWRARTYGLHFVEYFPNRELGIVSFRQGRIEEARQCFERSLEYIDTDRAHHYLDLVKKEEIARGIVQDIGAPALAITLKDATLLAAAPLDEAKPVAIEKAKPVEEAKPAPAPKPAPPKKTIVASRALAVDIGANDDVGVEEVTVNGRELHQRGSAVEIAFHKEMLLDEGDHEIEVAATDLADKEVIEKVEVTVDLTGPTIGVFSPIEPTVTPHGTVLLEGSTVDKNGVVSVVVGERMLAESEGAPRLDFDSELPLGDGENTFVLAARDVAGNEARSAIKVFKGDPDSTEAKLWLLLQKYSERMKLAHNQVFGPATLDILLSVTPEETGEIRLKSPNLDRPYRHNRTLRVSGEVVTRTRVASLSINGVSLEELSGAPKESFNRRIPINEGDIGEDGLMALEIRAEDENGAVLEKKFDIEMRPVELDRENSRMPVAVLAFAGHDLDTAVHEHLRVITETQLIEQARFRVLDRTRLQDVLTEQEMSAALADPNEAIKLGRLTPAHIFVIADVFAHGQKGLEVKARAISTETSDIMAILDVYVDDRDNREAVTRACDDLAEQLAKIFPRLSGELMGVRGANELLVNWTLEDGVREGMYMLVVHETEPWVDEDTGEITIPGEFVEVGRAKIISVLKNGSRARAVERKEEDVKLEKGMPAITM